MSRGCLEARIYQPSNWTAALTIAGLGGPTTVTVAASSTRYPTDFLQALATALAAAEVVLGGSSGFTVTASWSESGNGKVTIEYDGAGLVTLTWTSTDMRDLLGFTGNLSGATEYTGTAHARGVWLPDCSMAAKYGPNDAGHTETDMAQTVSPLGHVQTTVYSSRVRQPSVLWSHVTRARARIQGEVVAGESYERFWRYTQNGELGYFQAASPVRLIWDATDHTTFSTLVLTDRTGTEMERTVPEWSGLFPIEIAGYPVPS